MEKHEAYENGYQPVNSITVQPHRIAITFSYIRVDYDASWVARRLFFWKIIYTFKKYCFYCRTCFNTRPIFHFQTFPYVFDRNFYFPKRFGENSFQTFNSVYIFNLM